MPRKKKIYDQIQYVRHISFAKLAKLSSPFSLRYQLDQKLPSNPTWSEILFGTEERDPLAAVTISGILTHPSTLLFQYKAPKLTTTDRVPQ